MHCRSWSSLLFIILIIRLIELFLVTFSFTSCIRKMCCCWLVKILVLIMIICSTILNRIKTKMLLMNLLLFKYSSIILESKKNSLKIFYLLFIFIRRIKWCRIIFMFNHYNNSLILFCNSMNMLLLIIFYKKIN